MYRPITLLHLSDTQFGPNHRFGGLGLPPPDNQFDTLLVRLKDDLQGLEKNYGLRPELVILSGDLAERGQGSEFMDFLKFIDKLVQFLKLSRDRVVMVPGNHDINRALCEAYFQQCAGDEKPLKPPFWPKWKHYVSLFQRFYQDHPNIQFTEIEPWTLFIVPDLKLVVVGLNSTMAESHQDSDHYGYVGEAQLRWFAERLEPYKQQGWLRIGVLHHNVRRGPVVDDENLRDAWDLQRILGDYVNMVLHGHTHDGRSDVLCWDVPILSTGSAALTKEALPEETPNQYQVVQIWRDKFKRWTRAYVPTNKQWVGDNRASKYGDHWWEERHVDFEEVGATFP